MNKFFLIFTIFAAGFTFSQEKTASVEKSVTGVQIAVPMPAANIYTELRLADKFALKAEFGVGLLDEDWFVEDGDSRPITLFPKISLMPKYYYNLEKRVEKSKNIKNNSGNYLGLDMVYFFGNSEGAFCAIPTWGLRRNFSKNFNYEFKVGLGIWNDSYGVKPVPNIGFRLGYDF